MMNSDQHDELDRLLFALPLEEPPADLRASILASTIYRPAFPLKIWETWTLGALVAVIVWLCVLIARGGADAFVQTTGVFESFFAQALFAPSTWIWLAAGGGVAFVLMILNLSPMPAPAPQWFSRR